MKLREIFGCPLSFFVDFLKIFLFQKVPTLSFRIESKKLHTIETNLSESQTVLSEDYPYAKGPPKMQHLNVSFFIIFVFSFLTIRFLRFN